MSADYKPGLYVATVRGVPDVRVFRTLAHDELGWFCPVYQATDLGNGWWPDDDEVTEVRPLVVLDPDDRKQVERLMRVVRDNAFESGDSYPGMGRFADAMQAALRSQIKPPKPPEPQGLGAVVEDASGAIWVLVPRDGNAAQTEWVTHHSTCRTWGAIDAVRVLSDGWEPKP